MFHIFNECTGDSFLSRVIVINCGKMVDTITVASSSRALDHQDQDGEVGWDNAESASLILLILYNFMKFGLTFSWGTPLLDSAVGISTSLSWSWSTWKLRSNASKLVQFLTKFCLIRTNWNILIMQLKQTPQPTVLVISVSIHLYGWMEFECNVFYRF